MPTSRLTSALPVQHGSGTFVLLRILHYADGFRTAHRHARGHRRPRPDQHHTPTVTYPGPPSNKARSWPATPLSTKHAKPCSGEKSTASTTSPKAPRPRHKHNARPTVSFYTNNTLLIAGSLLFKDMKTMSELASGAVVQATLLAKGATEGTSHGFPATHRHRHHPLQNPC